MGPPYLRTNGEQWVPEVSFIFFLVLLSNTVRLGDPGRADNGENSAGIHPLGFHDRRDPHHEKCSSAACIQQLHEQKVKQVAGGGWGCLASPWIWNVRFSSNALFSSTALFGSNALFSPINPFSLNALLSSTSLLRSIALLSSTSLFGSTALLSSTTLFSSTALLSSTSLLGFKSPV